MKRIFIFIICALFATVSLLPCLVWGEGSFIPTDGYWYTSRTTPSFSNGTVSWVGYLYDDGVMFGHVEFGYYSSTHKDYMYTVALSNGDSSYAGLKQGNGSTNYGPLKSQGLVSTIELTHTASTVYYSMDWIKSHTGNLVAYVNEQY